LCPAVNTLECYSYLHKFCSDFGKRSKEALDWEACAAISLPGAGRSLPYQIKRKTIKIINPINPKKANFASLLIKIIFGVLFSLLKFLINGGRLNVK